VWARGGRQEVRLRPLEPAKAWILSNLISVELYSLILVNSIGTELFHSMTPYVELYLKPIFVKLCNN
jgi:hypothetical protein